MLINKKKTQVILFNHSKKYDFPPEVSFDDGTLLEVISETSLLGVVISDNLKWNRNVRQSPAKIMDSTQTAAV